MKVDKWRMQLTFVSVSTSQLVQVVQVRQVLSGCAFRCPSLCGGPGCFRLRQFLFQSRSHLAAVVSFYSWHFLGLDMNIINSVSGTGLTRIGKVATNITRCGLCRLPMSTWGRGWMTKASGVGERRKGRGELRRDCHHRVAALFVPTRMQQWYIDIWYITMIYMGEGAGGALSREKSRDVLGEPRNTC